MQKGHDNLLLMFFPDVWIDVYKRLKNRAEKVFREMMKEGRFTMPNDHKIYHKLLRNHQSLAYSSIDEQPRQMEVFNSGSPPIGPSA